MTTSVSPFRVSVVQAAPVLLDTPRTLDKLAALTAVAASEGARLVVFPEAFLGGYAKGRRFGASLGRRTPEGRDEFRAYFESAIEVPGPATEQVGQAARRGQIFLVVGAIERQGGTLYCTALFFGPDGALLGKHRKLMPTAVERVVWGCGDGSTLPVFETPLGKLGAVICWENYMPLLRMAMYAQGIQLYCAPTVDDRDSWIPTVRHIACEGRCFVLSACPVLTEAEIARACGEEPAKYDSPLAIRGGSCIVSPFGEFLAGPCYGEERVLTAEIDPGEIVRGKFDLDVTGHYARADVFQLRVNRQPQQPVIWQQAAFPADEAE